MSKREPVNSVLYHRLGQKKQVCLGHAASNNQQNKKSFHINSDYVIIKIESLGLGLYNVTTLFLIRLKLTSILKLTASECFPSLSFLPKSVANIASQRGVARGQGGGGGGRPQMTKSWCSRNAQICNNVDTLEGSIEIVSGCFPSGKGRIYKINVYRKGRFPNI